LLGSWRIQDSQTVWVDGPVVVAAKAGAILLIDEIDRSSSRIASLLGILEGTSILIKKTGEIVKPKEGFNIFATGNTKGRGSENGKYNFAIIVDDALLERFYINYEQEFPNQKQIHRILTSQAKVIYKTKELSENAVEFIDQLSKWVSIIFQTFENGAVEDVVSIRRAVQILKIWAMFENTSKAIKLGIARFDEIERNSFLDLFSKVSNIPLENPKSENTDEDELESCGKAPAYSYGSF
jgi:MoxR-like ATPase